MKILNKVLTVLIAVIFTLSVVIAVRASEQTKAQEGVIEVVVKYEMQNEITETAFDLEQITRDIISESINLNALNSNRYGVSFTSDMNKKLYGTSTLDAIYNSKIIELESHYIIPENSSSGDVVIILDTRMINPNNQEFLVMFEYHLNSNKEVYGMNTWVY